MFKTRRETFWKTAPSLISGVTGLIVGIVISVVTGLIVLNFFAYLKHRLWL